MRNANASRFFLLAMLLTLVAGPAFGEPIDLAEDLVRVRLHEAANPEHIRLENPASSLEVWDQGRNQRLLTVAPGTSLLVKGTSSRLALVYGGRTYQASAIRVVPQHSTGTTVGVEKGSKRVAEMQYPGQFWLYGEGQREVKVVNHVPMETYVASVVANEYGLGDLEGAKAQAVVARTYSIYKRKSFDGTYDLYDDTRSQVYRGLKKMTPLELQAAQETAGEVLTFNGEVIEAVYYSSSGGHTAANESVWSSTPIPYLRARVDPYDVYSPHHNWEYTVDQQRMLEQLGKAYGARLRGFEVADRSSDGRVASVRLHRSNGGKTVVSANSFRSKFTQAFGVRSLRSTFFDVRKQGSSYVFEGHGYGHGVGMSQWGAHAQSKAGRTYRDILSFYYTGVDLMRLPYANHIAEQRPSSHIAPQPQHVSSPPQPRRQQQPTVTNAAPSAEAGQRVRRRVHSPEASPRVQTQPATTTVVRVQPQRTPQHQPATPPEHETTRVQPTVQTPVVQSKPRQTESKPKERVRRVRGW